MPRKKVSVPASPQHRTLRGYLHARDVAYRKRRRGCNFEQAMAIELSTAEVAESKSDATGINASVASSGITAPTTGMIHLHIGRRKLQRKRVRKR